MQHDQMHHDSFDESGHLHDPLDLFDAHHHTIDDHAHHHQVDTHHVGLADILQQFQLTHTSQITHMIESFHSQHATLADHPGAPGHLPGQASLHPDSHWHASPLTHFQPGVSSYEIIGDPAHDMASWYHQIHPDTCAIASQGFVIESLTGLHISENVLVQEAQQHGWYTPGCGTPMYHVGDLLETHGIHTIHKEGASLADIASELQQHQKVLVGVNGEDFWYHGSPADPLAHYPGIPGQHADHAVEVIGIDDTRPDHLLVIINDPGFPDGRGLEVPVDVFYQAWSTSGYYMVATTSQSQGTNILPNQGAVTTYGGYYNADGTSHYESDNPDRDPQTGAIIRRW